MDLQAVINKIAYIDKEGNLLEGYDATILSLESDLYLAAREADAIKNPNKLASAHQAEKLVRLCTPLLITSRETNWLRLSTYFKYPPGIRNLIYTTNTIEGYHRQIRKVTKNQGIFTSDVALLKSIYLATERISRKWTVPIQNWAIAASQLRIIFGDRMKLDL